MHGSLAPFYKLALVESMKTDPFSVAIDGSNNTNTLRENESNNSENV